MNENAGVNIDKNEGENVDKNLGKSSGKSMVPQIRSSYFCTAVKGFEHIKRFRDATQPCVVAKILPGECYVSQTDEMISTVLGSCISVCMRDPVVNVGGMNHFMLPLQMSESCTATVTPIGPALCYGNWAMEYLVNAILKLGGHKNRLEVKVFGGGSVLAGMKLMNIGEQNIDFVLAYLEQEKLPITAKDIGGIYPRKIQYFARSGVVRMKKLKVSVDGEISRKEAMYLASIANNTRPRIELF